MIPNVHCREAIEYAADKLTLQDAYGGPVIGGQVASTVMPPTVLGYKSFDLYRASSQPGGDDSDARAQLQQCGKPGGFSFNIAYRADTSGDPQAATALQAALRKVGISTTLQGFPTSKYYTNFAGVPAYVHAHDIGVAIGGWGADWPDGYGFLFDLSDGSTIIPVGNTNISEVNDPAINTPVQPGDDHLQPVSGAGHLAEDRQADHEGRRDPADRLPAGAAVPAAGRHERICG